MVQELKRMGWRFPLRWTVLSGKRRSGRQACLWGLTWLRTSRLSQCFPEALGDSPAPEPLSVACLTLSRPAFLPHADDLV